MVFKTTAIDHSAIPPRRNSALICAISSACRRPRGGMCHRSVTDASIRADPDKFYPALGRIRRPWFIRTVVGQPRTRSIV